MHMDDRPKSQDFQEPNAYRKGNSRFESNPNIINSEVREIGFCVQPDIPEGYEQGFKSVLKIDRPGRVEFND